MHASVSLCSYPGASLLVILLHLLFLHKVARFMCVSGARRRATGSVRVRACFQQPGLGVLIAGKGCSFKHCLAEADALLEQSLRLEQAGDPATALALLRHIVCK